MPLFRVRNLMLNQYFGSVNRNKTNIQYLGTKNTKKGKIVQFHYSSLVNIYFVLDIGPRKNDTIWSTLTLDPVFRVHRRTSGTNPPPPSSRIESQRMLPRDLHSGI